MSKPSNKTTNFKKVLVRNTLQPLPKPSSNTTDGKSVNSKPKKQAEEKTEESAFEFPELYSALRLSKKLEEITDYRKKKSSFEGADGKGDKLAFDEKITRKVNFPYDQPIYKDLIQLSTPTTSQTATHKRPPQPHKDKEPTLEDFATIYEPPEFFYIPETPNHNKPTTHSLTNNLRLYQILQIHNK